MPGKVTVVRAQGTSPALHGRWQRPALEAAVPSSAERDEIRQLRAALKRVEMERDSLKKVVTIFSQPPPSGAATCCARGFTAMACGR